MAYKIGEQAREEIFLSLLIIRTLEFIRMVWDAGGTAIIELPRIDLGPSLVAHPYEMYTLTDDTRVTVTTLMGLHCPWRSYLCFPT